LWSLAVIRLVRADEERRDKEPTCKYPLVSLVSFIDIASGLLVLSSWGVADFLARMSSVRIGSGSTAFLVQALGLAVPATALCISLALGSDLNVDVGRTLLLGISTGGILGLAYVVYYNGLERGSVSIVSAIASAWLVVTLLFAALAFGESISWSQATLIGVVVTGIFAVGFQRQSVGVPNAGVSYGLAAMVMLGVALALWVPLTKAAGPLLAVFTARAFAAMVTGGYLWAKGIGLHWPNGRVAVLTLCGAAALDSLGFVAYNIGIERASLVVIAPFAAAHPVGTIILALLILGERPVIRQWVGMALVVAGVAALSAVAGV